MSSLASPPGVGQVTILQQIVRGLVKQKEDIRAQYESELQRVHCVLSITQKTLDNQRLSQVELKASHDRAEAKNSALESELKAEQERRASVEASLVDVQQSRVQTEAEFTRLERDFTKLESECRLLKSALLNSGLERISLAKSHATIKDVAESRKKELRTQDGFIALLMRQRDYLSRGSPRRSRGPSRNGQRQSKSPERSRSRSRSRSRARSRSGSRARERSESPKGFGRPISN